MTEKNIFFDVYGCFFYSLQRYFGYHRPSKGLSSSVWLSTLIAMSAEPLFPAPQGLYHHRFTVIIVTVAMKLCYVWAHRAQRLNRISDQSFGILEQ